MPFGITWGHYLKIWAVAITGMVCGSSVVHMTYKPLDTIDEDIAREVKKMKESMGITNVDKEAKLRKILDMDVEYLTKYKPDTSKDAK